MRNLWNMKTLEVNLERVIDATPAEVFDAWLDPEHPGSPWYADAYKLLTNASLEPKESQTSWLGRVWGSVF